MPGEWDTSTSCVLSGCGYLNQWSAKIISEGFSRPICKNFAPGKVVIFREMYCIFGSLCPSTQYVRKAVDYVTTKFQLPGDCLALEIKPKCWSLVLPVLPFLPTNRMPTCRTFIWQCFISLPVWEGHLFENLFKNKTTCLCATCKRVSDDLIHAFLTDLPFGLRYWYVNVLQYVNTLQYVSISQYLYDVQILLLLLTS